ncbi:MAG: type II secretion system F family protein [Hyphomicrobiales bacterium]
MIETLVTLLEPRNLVVILVGIAVFATVLTVFAPLLQRDELAARMKSVSTERERLKVQYRQAITEGRLRDKPKGLVPQLVNALNLRKVFEAESMRDTMRQAGFRSESHLVTFLAFRLIMPIAFGIIAFTYANTVFAERLNTPLLKLMGTMGGIIAGYYLPVIFITNMIHRRQTSIKRAWSDALDLLLICVESGMALEPAMQRVSKEIGSQSIPLAEELTLTTAELSYLGDRRKALENLARRTGLPTVKAVVTSFIQAERYGTPLGTALRVLAQENRDNRMAEAERKAAALPPKLTVPMVLFFLPVIFIVLLGPSLIKVFGWQ